MTDPSEEGRNEQELARHNRLAKALRDNLKRRKSQSRGRAGPAEAPDPASLPADPSRQPACDTES